MSLFVSIPVLLGGFLLVIRGADFLVKGASSLAKRWGISSLVIGLTIVSFGTSAPELVVNLFASVAGNNNFVIGNVIGSNIANILLILGVTGLVRQLEVKRSTVWKEIPFSLLAAVMVAIVSADFWLNPGATNIISRGDSLVLLGFFVIFVVYTFGLSPVKGNPDKVEKLPYNKSIFYVLGGIFALGLGGKLVIEGAVNIAELLAIPERIIGLTILALGTSLPELATSVVAAYHDEADIAIGNVVGSCIFNALFVLGLSGLVSPIALIDQNLLDIGVSIFATLLLFSVIFIGKRNRLDKLEAVIFLIFYAMYIIFILQ